MNASRGTVRNASRTSGSVIPRRRSCRSIISSRSAAKSVGLVDMVHLRSFERTRDIGLTLPPRERDGGATHIRNVPYRAREADQMKDMELRFAGSVPASYDRMMVPLIFQPY